MHSNYLRTNNRSRAVLSLSATGYLYMWEYIKLGNQTHQFGAMGSWTTQSTYLYYNNVTFPSFAAGAELPIEVKPYSVQDGEPLYFAVFIDYNKNNKFESDEIVMQNSNTIMAALPTFGATASPITKSITLPKTLTAGTYRMRLMRDGFGGFSYDNKYVITNTCVSKTEFGYGNTYDFDLKITAATTGITANELNESGLTILNNVSSDYLAVQSAASIANYSYTIIAINGQTLQTQKLSEQIDITTLNKGLYFIAITNEENQLVYQTRFIRN